MSWWRAERIEVLEAFIEELEATENKTQQEWQQYHEWIEEKNNLELELSDARE